MLVVVARVAWFNQINRWLLFCGLVFLCASAVEQRIIAQCRTLKPHVIYQRLHNSLNLQGTIATATNHFSKKKHSEQSEL